MDKLEKKHWIGAGLLGLGVSAVGLWYLYNSSKSGHRSTDEKDIVLVQMLKSAGLLPRKEKGPLTFEEYVAITKIKYTEMKKRLLPKCKEYEKQRIALIKDGKLRDQQYQDLVRQQVAFQEKVDLQIQKVLIEKLGLSLRDFSLAELKHSTNQQFLECIKEVFETPDDLTENKAQEIFEEMYQNMEQEVKLVLNTEFKGDVTQMLAKYRNSMILETEITDCKAIELGIDSWTLFQAMQKYNYSLSWVFEKLFRIQ